MKLRYRGDGRVMIENIAHEFKAGDTIDLPEKVAKNLLKVNRFFEEVKEKRIKIERIKVKE